VGGRWPTCERVPGRRNTVASLISVRQERTRVRALTRARTRGARSPARRRCANNPS
jgi:hypothetical protein